MTLDCVTTAAIEGPADQISFQAVFIATPRREHARATTANTDPDARKPVKEAPQNVTACFNAHKGKGAPKMINVSQSSARPGGSTGTSSARRRVSYKGTPRRARVPPVDFRDGLSQF